MNLIFFPQSEHFPRPGRTIKCTRCTPRIMPPPAPSTRPSSSKMSRIPRSVFFLLFTVSGFAGLIYESIWSHYLKLFLGHAAYAQTLVLALFMGGMAIGSWLCSRWSAGWGNLLRGYALAEALIGFAALSFHPIFVSATDAAYASILPALGGEIPATLFKWTLAGLLILPQSVLLGMTFPLMSAGLIRRYPAAPGESLAMPNDAKTVWERIERGPCSSRVAPDERQWIDLMKAVGNRAAPDMARLAEALLAKSSDLPTGHRQYLMAAGMAGYLAQGKRAEAGALWSRYPKDVDKTGDVGLRLLYAHAFELK